MFTLNFMRITGFAFTGLLLASCGSPASYDGKEPPAGKSNAPTVTITALSSTVDYNAGTTISWTSTNATTCSSSGGGAKTTEGSFNTGSLTETTSYTVTCSGTGGSTSKGITITVTPSQITGFVNSGGAGNVTATSQNKLSSGMTITISGTTSYNGTYTVISATSSNFVFAHSFVSGSENETGSWQLAGGMISGCSSTGNTSAIMLAQTPSRFNGVAPLSVFFDASNTVTAPVTPHPFHDLEYRWDFGDTAGSPVSGTTWLAGSRANSSSRNEATGAVAAHVFENPGTYIVSVSATDGNNVVENKCAQIVVQDPDLIFSGTNTICVGSSNLPTPGVDGCPQGATAVIQANFATAIGSYAKTGKRVLFQRGDTFVAPSSASITQTGPGIVGSFGSSTMPPKVQMTGSTVFLNISSASTPTIKDWRIMDLEFDGLNNPNAVGMYGYGTINQFTILRMYIHDLSDGILFPGSVIVYNNSQGSYPWNAVWDQFTIADTKIQHNINGGVGSFIAAERLAFMGNFYDDTTQGQHVLRLTYVNKGVVSNSTLSRQATGRLLLKLHGPGWCDSASPAGTCLTADTNPPGPNFNYLTNTPPSDGLSNGYTEKVIISDNKFIDGVDDWSVALGPTSQWRDERLRDIIVERNWFIAGSGTQVALLVWATDTTVRNNLCDRTGALSELCFRVEQHGYEPPPNNVNIYNNTFFSRDKSTTGRFGGVDIRSPASNIKIVNNLGSAPLSTTPAMITWADINSFVQSNNLMYSGAFTNLFVNSTPVVPSDCSLAATSPALNQGLTTVPVYSDFFAKPRQSGSPISIGFTGIP